MSEWLKVPVLKTGIPGKVSGVRILLHPKRTSGWCWGFNSIGRVSPIDLVYAGMVELVDTLDLGSRGSNLAGSSPATRKKTPVEPTTFMASIT